MTTDHAALCRNLLAALIETRDAAGWLINDADGYLPESYTGWLVRAAAAIREAQEALK